MLTHREQAPLVKSWIQKRFDTVLPALMQREKIDMWIIVSREYNDDPVFRSMAPLTTYSSRRRTILVFHERGGARRSPVDRPLRLRRPLHGRADGQRRAVGRPAHAGRRAGPAGDRHQHVRGLEPCRRSHGQRKGATAQGARAQVRRARASRPRCSPSAGSRRRSPKKPTPTGT